MTILNMTASDVHQLRVQNKLQTMTSFLHKPEPRPSNNHNPHNHHNHKHKPTASTTIFRTYMPPILAVELGFGAAVGAEALAPTVGAAEEGAGPAEETASEAEGPYAEVDAEGEGAGVADADEAAGAGAEAVPEEAGPWMISGFSL
jgi:hypothetical protein